MQEAKVEAMTAMEEITYPENPSRSTSKQFFLGLIVYLSSIAPSMSLGFSAIALPPLEAADNPYKLDGNQASWVASIASLATPLGCFLSGPISDRYGRKSALLSINVVTLIGWLIIVLAYHLPESQYGILLIGRLFTGLSTGLASMPAAVYMAEVASPKLRGMFITASAVFFGLGILTVYILGALFKENWGMTAIITSGIPCLAFGFTMIFLPESPSWLVSKDRVQDARTNLRKIFGQKQYTREVDAEIEALIVNREKNKIGNKRPKQKENAGDYDQNNYVQRNSEENHYEVNGEPNKNLTKEVLVKGPLEIKSRGSFLNSARKKLKYMCQPTCWKPFLIIMTFFFFMQFSGIFVVIFYAIHIVHDAGIQEDPYKIIVLIGVTRLLSAMSVSIISRKYGRRPLSIISGSGMTICMLLLACFLALIHNDLISEDLQNQLSWLPIVLLVVYFITSTLGFLTMPFAMNAEVFPTKVRGIATGMTSGLAYLFSFVIIKIYPAMVERLESYGVFCFYGAMSLLGTLFIVVYLPETKGKTLREIEEYFGKKRTG